MKTSKSSTESFAPTEFALPDKPDLSTPAEAVRPATDPAPKPQWTAEQFACRQIAKLAGGFADLAETVTHTHGAPQERTRLLDTIREAGTVGKAAFKSNTIWGGYHVDPAEALKRIKALQEELLTLEGTLIEVQQLTAQKTGPA